jgi:N-acetylmuramoyl-L-alanine amidase
MPLLSAFLSVLLSLAPALAALPTWLSGQREKGQVTLTLEPAAAAATYVNPPISGARGSGRPLVVIDPGHGGQDPGAISPYGQRHEKDVTLALARAIRDELVKSGRVRVALTRDDDRYIDLHERYEIARRIKADLFISVHADSASNGGARGATIYTLSEVASDREAATLATRENKADIIRGIDMGGRSRDVNAILIDLAQRESMNISSDFAGRLYREASPLVPFRPQHHRFAAFVVLKSPDVPSILFESGYLSNPDDVGFIYSPDGRQRIATGMRRAIEAHFARQIVAAARRERV